MRFTYIWENLIFEPTIIESLIGVVIGIFIIFLMRFLFLYGYGMVLMRKEAIELKRKKDTLSDLILMKDIQTELEREIEQAMLKATFQS